jgi:hypothetical protein
VEHERVCLAAQLCDNELHTLKHQPTNEVHISAQAIELADQYRQPALLRRLQSFSQLRATVQGITALTCLNLRVPVLYRDPFAAGEGFDGLALGLETEPGAALLLRADPQVADGVRAASLSGPL